MRERVVAARERQAARLAGTGAACNAQHGRRARARGTSRSTPTRSAVLRRAYDRGTLSARAATTASLRVARTIADLDGCDTVGAEHAAARRSGCARTRGAAAAEARMSAASACDACLRRTWLRRAARPGWIELAAHERAARLPRGAGAGRRGAAARRSRRGGARRCASSSARTRRARARVDAAGPRAPSAATTTGYPAALRDDRAGAALHVAGGLARLAALRGRGRRPRSSARAAPRPTGWRWRARSAAAWRRRA